MDKKTQQSIEKIKPKDNTLSSQNSISAYASQLDIIKSVDKDSASIKTILTYTVVINNPSTEKANNIIFFDYLDGNVEFIAGSFTLNGLPINGVDLQKGISIGASTPGSSIILSYKVIVTGIAYTISNEAVIKYTLGSSPDIITTTSNIVEVTYELPCIYLLKTSIPTTIKANEKVKYLITIINGGAITLTNLVLNDHIDTRLEIVKGSIEINGNPAGTDSLCNLKLPPLPPTNLGSSGIFEILFEATVKNYEDYMKYVIPWCECTNPHKDFTVCNQAEVIYGVGGCVIGIIKSNVAKTLVKVT